MNTEIKHYIYLNPQLKCINITDYPTSIFGDLIGTSTVWHKATANTKKFILASCVANSPYKGMTGLRTIDGPGPSTDLLETS